MKKLLLAGVVLSLVTSVALAQDWVPTPMVIDAKNTQYAFNGTPVQIKFDLEGKPAKIWLIIESMLPDAQKPVAVTNGFKDWHFVNGIDTTIYVSTSRLYSPGNNLDFEWDGHGNEVEERTANKVDTGIVTPGTYTYYLWGYDYLNTRENAIDFIAVGNYWAEQFNRFYTKDEQGVTLARPLYMGTMPTAPGHTSTAIPSAAMFKWTMGNNPLVQELVSTSKMWGFNTGDIVEGKAYKYGAGTFLPNDFNKFVFVRGAHWEHATAPVMWNYVAGGQAIQETWGDFDSGISWYWPATKTSGNTLNPTVQTDGEYLYVLDPGQNPMEFQHDKFHIVSIEDPTDEPWYYNLDEFYWPDMPDNPTGGTRKNGEINRFDAGIHPGQYLVGGDWTCLTELIDTDRMLAGSFAPFSADGSGYVVWRNSNGDFFNDRGSDPSLLNDPSQLWACVISDPRNDNCPRQENTPQDMNGFWISHLEFTGIHAFSVYTPDGSGVDWMAFGDDSYSTGQVGVESKRGGGEAIDCESIYDGIYVNGAVTADLRLDNAVLRKTMWIASDSDKAIIAVVIDTVAVEADKAPAAFTVAQNSPNPFNPTTTISFTLAKEGNVSVEVFNVAGQKVSTLANDFMTVGSHSVTWDARDMAAGLYFYTVKTGDYSKTMKMTLLK